MHELDLIPASYREWLKVKGWFRLFVLGISLVVIAVVALKFTVAKSTKAIAEKIEILQRNKVVNLSLQKKYNDLVAEEVKIRRKDLDVLHGLQGGPSARQLLMAIDRAVQTGVWFTQWSFIRAREVIPAQSTTTQNSYFIVIPQEVEGAPSVDPQAWKLTAHMEISGQALDHSRFSNLVTNLIQQPEIDDVKVINTSLRSYLNLQVVDFKIVVVINNKFKDGDVRALLKQVNARMLAFLLVSVFFLLLVASYLYILKRPFQDMRQAKQTLALLESELQSGIPLDNQIQNFQDQVEALRRQLHGSGKNVPMNQMIAFVIGQLDHISASHHVKLISVEPGGVEKVYLFQELPFHLVVTGSYFKLYDWLTQVESELGPFVVKAFEITPELDSTTRRFTLTLAFYHFPEKS